MSEDYRKGFKDGFELGLAEGKRNQNLNPVPSYAPWPSTSPNISLRETCPKCGIKIDGVMGYVCSSINCPVQYKTTSILGAVGSDVSYTVGAEGANGPPGPQGKMPSYEEEQDRLRHYNQVWINGQWTELGG